MVVGVGVRERFKQYDVDRSGRLSHPEVRQICADLDYEVDDDYVDGVMADFTNRKGWIGFIEFKKLWDHLGGEERLSSSLPGGVAEDGGTWVKVPRGKKPGDMLTIQTAAGRKVEVRVPDGAQDGDEFEVSVDDDPTPETSTVASHGNGGDAELREVFSKYDLQKTGQLTNAEVNAMLVDLGYETNDEYLNGLMDSFGQFDDNDDGMISLAEFGELWEFVGGHNRLAHVNTEHEAATKIQAMQRGRKARTGTSSTRPSTNKRMNIKEIFNT